MTQAGRLGKSVLFRVVKELRQKLGEGRLQKSFLKMVEVPLFAALFAPQVKLDLGQLARALARKELLLILGGHVDLCDTVVELP